MAKTKTRTSRTNPIREPTTNPTLLPIEPGWNRVRTRASSGPSPSPREKGTTTQWRTVANSSSVDGERRGEEGTCTCADGHQDARTHVATGERKHVRAPWSRRKLARDRPSARGGSQEAARTPGRRKWTASGLVLRHVVVPNVLPSRLDGDTAVERCQAGARGIERREVASRAVGRGVRRTTLRAAVRPDRWKGPIRQSPRWTRLPAGTSRHVYLGRRETRATRFGRCRAGRERFGRNDGGRRRIHRRLQGNLAVSARATRIRPGLQHRTHPSPVPTAAGRKKERAPSTGHTHLGRGDEDLPPQWRRRMGGRPELVKTSG
mmetsp:Transcript_1612/g.9934  ORF Transcript_1612/g.9934 Transcript_1612/m.9934 type:complete len:320 (-) Transcript_1612:2030-2989(-)